MNPQPIVREGVALRLEAVANGKAQANVRAIRINRGEPELLHTDVLDIVRDRARRRFVDALPEDVREEGLSLTLDVASLLVEGRAASSKIAATAESSEHFESLEPWPDSVDGAVLLDEIDRTLTQFLVLPPGASTAIALWLAHTYAPDVTDVTPYLLIRSPVRECGKTTLLEILKHLAYRALLTAGITAAALYRVIDKYNPTILFDELDTRLRGDSGEMLRGILNSGFQRGEKAMVCQGDQHEVRGFATYCPKALAGIGRPWDTVESRSIPIRMSRASRDQRKRLRKVRSDRIRNEFAPLRMKLRRWVDDIRNILDEADPAVPEVLGARQADMWRPLLAIADVAGGRWPDLAREHALLLHGEAADESDRGLLLLEDVRDLFAKAVDSYGVAATRLASEHIVRELEKMEHRPWPEHHQGKPISKRGVAALLARFDVKPKVHRDGRETVRGYELAALEPVFQKYLTIDAPQGAESSVTSVTGASSPPETECYAVTDDSGVCGAKDLFDEEALEERLAIQAEGSTNAAATSRAHQQQVAR